MPNEYARVSMVEDDISPEEQEVLKRFRVIINNKGLHSPGRDDDQLLLKFLRARLLDLPKATTMYQEYVRWREENNVSSILKEFSYPELDQVLQAWPQTWHKTDKHGRPVNIQLFSRLNVEALFRLTTEERVSKRGIWVLEDLHENKLPECSRAAGRYIGRVSVVVDLRNVGITTFTNGQVRRILSSFAHIFSQYYPEYLGKLIILNAPLTFKLIWQMLSPFMDEKTKKKISIHKGDALEELLAIIPADDLPKFLGGNCDCSSCHILNKAAS